MSERSEKRIVVLRVGFLLFKIITLIGCYLLIRASNPENITYNWGQIIQLILGGPIVLLGILGILVFPIMLIRTEGGLTRKYLVWALLFPGVALALAITLAIAMKPLNGRHMKFQNNLGKRNYRAINMEGKNLTRMIMDGAKLASANLKNANMSNVSLEQANLSGSNLEGTILMEADLEGVNLKDAIVDEASLLSASSLRHAIKPDGNKYDGRYILEGDLYGLEHTMERWEGSPCDNDKIADFYGISIADYLHGMDWFQENLPLMHTPAGDLRGKDVRGEIFIFADFSNMDLRDTIFYCD